MARHRRPAFPRQKARILPPVFGIKAKRESQISNIKFDYAPPYLESRQSTHHSTTQEGRLTKSRPSGLPVRDTADWQSALRWWRRMAGCPYLSESISFEKNRQRNVGQGNEEKTISCNYSSANHSPAISGLPSCIFHLVAALPRCAVSPAGNRRRVHNDFRRLSQWPQTKAGFAELFPHVYAVVQMERLR